MLGSTWNKMIAVFAIGIPACVLGGVAYSLASGRDILTGFIQAYGALYKIPGKPDLFTPPVPLCTMPWMHVLFMWLSLCPATPFI